MIDALIEIIPWDKVGEVALDAGIAVLAAVGIEVGSRLLTGKGLFEHIRDALSGIEEELKSWLERKRKSNVVIKKFVLVIESCITPITLVNKGIERIKVAIFGESDTGKRHNTGKVVITEFKKKDAENLKSKKEVEAELAELGFAEV